MTQHQGIIRTDDIRKIPLRERKRAWIIIERGIIVKDRFTGITGVPA